MSLLFTKVKDGNTVTLNLTTTGYTVLVIAIIALVLLGCAIFGKNSKSNTRQIAFSSVALAIAFVASMIKLFHLPMGGSVTLFSMFFVTLIGYWYGLGAGITAAAAYGLLQLVADPYIISVPQMLTDYILAYGALGLSGLFKNSKYGLIKGYITAILGRYFFAVLSGVIFFGSYSSLLNMKNSLGYSLIYNGAYIFSEAGITLILLVVPNFNKSFRNGLSSVTQLAVGESRVN
ncbi:thiamine transporter [Lachnospiraceae bacterium C7]|nr:thiamine transporter [Lachnospiraceae bacterium C7]